MFEYLLQTYGLWGFLAGMLGVMIYRQHRANLRRQEREQARYDDLSKRAEEMENRLLAEMRQQKTDLQQELEDKNKRIDLLERQVERYRGEAVTNDKERQRMEGDLRELRLSTEAQLRDMARQLSETQILYKAEQKHAADLQATNNRLLADTSHLRQSNDRMSERMDGMRDENKQLNLQIVAVRTELEAEIQKLKDQVRELQAQLKQKDEQIARMQQEAPVTDPEMEIERLT